VQPGQFIFSTALIRLYSRRYGSILLKNGKGCAKMSSVMKYLSCLLCWFVLNLFWLSPLWAMSCPSSPTKVEIVVQFIKAAPFVNNRASQRRLARKSVKRGFHSQTIGLTESRLTLKVLTSFTIGTSNRSRQSCVTLKTIRLNYGFGKTPVLIDRRYRPGSCEYAAIYNHEAEHVRIMNRKGWDYLPWIKQEIARKVKSIRPILTSRSRRTQRQIADQVKRAASVLTTQMNNSLAIAHAVIDTQENYRQTQSRCSHW
jgi:hypothetical protein